MSAFVIDTSVAAKWLFLEEGSAESEALLEEFSFFYAPDIFPVELDAVISRKMRKKEITAAEALKKQAQRQKLPCKLVQYGEISSLAFEIAITLPVTLYDAAFVATAIERDGMVYTADQKLVNGVSNSSLGRYVESIWDL